MDINNEKLMEVWELDSWEEAELKFQELTRIRNEFLAKNAPIRVSKLAYRGQEDHSWALETTLDRAVAKEVEFMDYFKLVSSAKSRIETFTEKSWTLPTYSEYEKWCEGVSMLHGESLPAQSFMIYLRHHGFPSPLLDWSQSPYVAAFFAFNRARRECEKVSIFAHLDDVGQGKTMSGNELYITTIGPYSSGHRRHYLQQCTYSICYRVAGDTRKRYGRHQDFKIRRDLEEQNRIWKLNIPVNEKGKVLGILDKYNINAFSLFGSEEALMESIATREIVINERFS